MNGFDVQQTYHATKMAQQMPLQNQTINQIELNNAVLSETLGTDKELQILIDSSKFIFVKLSIPLLRSVYETLRNNKQILRAHIGTVIYTKSLTHPKSNWLF